MKELIRKVLREFVEEPEDFVEEPEDFVEEPDLCRVEYTHFNVQYKLCYLNFLKSDDIKRIKNNDGECEEVELYNEPGEKHIIPIDEIKFTKNNNFPYVDKDYFYENIYPKLNINTKLVGGIASKNIKEALKRAFGGTPNWSDETEDMSEGVINIEPTVGGNNWSVMNYFDSKTTVHNHLKALISQDNNKNPEVITGSKNVKIIGNEDKKTYDEWVVNWLSKVFKGEIHADKLNDIKNIQKVSIESGLETENDAIDYIKNHPEVLGLNGITETVMYEPGHKKDRWGGVDVEFYGDGTLPIGVQIKPLSRYNQIKNSVSVGSSNANDYKDKGKEGVDYLVFFNSRTNKIVVFKNSNYKISGSSYIFNEQPVYPIFMDDEQR